MITGFVRFFPSTVPPEQPLFNGIAEMSRRSKPKLPDLHKNVYGDRGIDKIGPILAH